jgi:hypothetical protein
MGLSSSGLCDQAFSIGTSFRCATGIAKGVPPRGADANWREQSQLARARARSCGARGDNETAGAAPLDRAKP